MLGAHAHEGYPTVLTLCVCAVAYPGFEGGGC